MHFLTLYSFCQACGVDVNADRPVPGTISSRMIAPSLPVQVLAAYSYLAAVYRTGDHCEIQVCASIGSLVCALTKGVSDQEGAFDWGR